MGILNDIRRKIILTRNCLVIYLPVRVNVRNAEKLRSLVTKNSEKVCLLNTKMKIIMFNNFSFRRILFVNKSKIFAVRLFCCHPILSRKTRKLTPSEFFYMLKSFKKLCCLFSISNTKMNIFYQANNRIWKKLPWIQYIGDQIL